MYRVPIMLLPCYDYFFVVFHSYFNWVNNKYSYDLYTYTYIYIYVCVYVCIFFLFIINVLLSYSTSRFILIVTFFI